MLFIFFFEKHRPAFKGIFFSFQTFLHSCLVLSLNDSKFYQAPTKQLQQEELAL